MMRSASLMKMRASSSGGEGRQRAGTPFHVAPPPRQPAKTSPSAGMRMTPASATPSRTTPSSMPKSGMPEMKERVPSIGSTIQV